MAQPAVTGDKATDADHFGQASPTARTYLLVPILLLFALLNRRSASLPEPDFQRRHRQRDHRVRTADSRDLLAHPDRHGGARGRRSFSRAADRIHQREPDPALRRRCDCLSLRVLRLRDHRGRPLSGPDGPHHRLRPCAAHHRRAQRLPGSGRPQPRHTAAPGRGGPGMDDALGPRHLDLVTGPRNPGSGDGGLVPARPHRLLRPPSPHGLRRTDRIHGRGAHQHRAPGRARGRGRLQRARGADFHLPHQLRRSDPGHDLHPDGGDRPGPRRHQSGGRTGQHHRFPAGRPQYLPHHLRAFDLQLRHGAELRDRCRLRRDSGRVPSPHPGPAPNAGGGAAHLALRLLRRAGHRRLQCAPPRQGRDRRAGRRTRRFRSHRPRRRRLGSHGAGRGRFRPDRAGERRFRAHGARRRRLRSDRPRGRRFRIHHTGRRRVRRAGSVDRSGNAPRLRRAHHRHRRLPHLPALPPPLGVAGRLHRRSPSSHPGSRPLRRGVRPQPARARPPKGPAPPSSSISKPPRPRPGPRARTARNRRRPRCAGC